MKPFSQTDRYRALKKEYDRMFDIGKFDVALGIMRTIERERREYIELHKK
jgi:hypothetical protein